MTMKNVLTAGLAIALASFASGVSVISPSPAQALTAQEAAGIGIGVTALTCALSNGCFNQPNYYRPREVRPYYQQPAYIVPVVPVRPVYRNDDRYYSSRPYRRSRDISVVINSIYVEVLGRNADYHGLRTYQDRYNSGWSIEDIRNDVARSEEARFRYRY